LILVVATAGKFGGTVLPARLCGMPWREASALGVLMNTRGLMELIVLNIGLDLKVISPALFAMMILMALVTTLITTPVILLMKPNWSFSTEASRPARVQSRRFTNFTHP
jgi:Kef-type K+ transport system membrane component KefB